MFLEKATKGENQWYRYVLTLAITFIAIQIASIPVLLYSAYMNTGSILQSSSFLVPNTNPGLALVLFPFAVGVITLLICIRFIHQKKSVDILTGRNRFDIHRFLFGAGIWGIITLLSLLSQYLLSDKSELLFQFEPLPFIIMCVIVITLIPFQVAFEEFIFRGYLMQGFALLFKYRWIAILMTGIIFGLLHSSNPEVERFGYFNAMSQYILMGLILGYIAVKDDGIELALGLHFANNALASILVTHDSAALQTHALFKDLNPASSYWDPIIILIGGILFIWICDNKYRFFPKINIWKKI
ncbi:CPBP family intramembrane glutamic endopeptidase [Gabonibacter massiliensis]|uniref:CPBP family intramembrane glutamic endopeptidase n=1 Tax=Gabonibacter massiliensis TaxID=1720195 RepID=UPI00073F1620|nr:CPBP family intramembrane glutamic endopeptidase [Gabonibacter massiliensis]